MSRVDLKWLKDLAGELKCAADRGDIEECRRLLLETMDHIFVSSETAGILAGILIESIRVGLLRPENVRRAMTPLWLALQMDESTENSDSAGDDALTSQPALPVN